MRNPRIYTPQTLTANTDIVLDTQAANHVANVLRMKAGETLFLFNGEAGHYFSTLVSIEKKQVVVKLSEQRFNNAKSPLQITIGQGLSRGERMDYAIQKATELGMHAITPLFTERCEVKLDNDRANKRQQHWQQTAISACEQCGRDNIPIINAPMTVADFISSAKADLKLVLHHEAPANLRDAATPKTIVVLIGPEGGLTENEITLATQHGFIATALGPRVLRTETAPVTALSVLQFLWGDI